MVEVLALASRLDVDWLPDVLEQAASMLITAAMKASLITMKSSSGCAVNPEQILCGHRRLGLSDIAPSA